MYTLPRIQDLTIGQRRREDVEVDIPDEPSAKRHHQRHLSSPPKPRTTFSTRYLLRNSRECTQRDIAATVPGESPVPILVKRPRIVVDADISDKPQAKHHHERQPTSPPLKRQTRSSTKSPTTIQITHSATISAPTSTAIPVRPSGAFPFRFAVETASTTSNPTHLPWDQLPEATQNRLSTQYDDLVSRVWGSPLEFWGDTWIDYTHALGLSTREKPDGVPEDDLLDKFPNLRDALHVAQVKCNFYELCHHREWLCSYSSMYLCIDRAILALFFNDLDASIDEALAEVEPLFIPSAILYLSSHGRSSAYTCGDLHPLAIEKTSCDGHNYYRIERNFVERKCVTYLLVFANPFTHPTFVKSRSYRVEDIGLGTLSLLRELGAHWGFYFAYSPNKTAEEARASQMSQDLILATQELGSIMDTATRSHKTESYHTALAHRCFYALYLTRIIVLSRFLECFPRDIDLEYARAGWAVFQHAPPRMPDGDDVFSAAYRHVTRARGSVFDLRRTVKARVRALAKSNRRLSIKLPFDLAVDEVEATISQNPSSSHRPACSRLSVSALLSGFVKPL